MKRIAVTIFLVVAIVLAVGAVALAGSSALDAPPLSNVDPSGGGGIPQNVE